MTKNKATTALWGVALLIEKFKGLRVERINNKDEITFQPFNHSTVKLHKQCAFTLTEVLITIAIIGVVAAMTLPTLIAQNQQKGWDTADSVFKKRFGEALKIMNSQGTLAGYSDTLSFVSELSKHLKIVKICNNTDLLSCFEDKVLWGGGDGELEEVEISKIKTAKDFGLKDKWNVITDIVGIQLANGTSGLIAYNPECKQDPYSNQVIKLLGSINGRKGSVTLDTADCVAVLYDTSGFAKPNTKDKDLRALNVPELGKSCGFKLNETCYAEPHIITPTVPEECVGVSSSICDNKRDYGASAAEYCGGADKVIKGAQLTELARYLYPSITVAAQGMSYCQGSACFDGDRAVSLGLPVNAGFFVYSSGNSRLFTPGMTNQYAFGSMQMQGTPVMAICVVD